MTTATANNSNQQWQPEFSRWRHGGWYVDNLRYPSGAVGCVSRNYPDKKWRIVCDPRPFEERPTFGSRDAAARGEWALIESARGAEEMTVTGHQHDYDPQTGSCYCGDVWDESKQSDSLAAVEG